jgi:hypothetical protein
MASRDGLDVYGYLHLRFCGVSYSMVDDPSVVFRNSFLAVGTNNARRRWAVSYGYGSHSRGNSVDPRTRKTKQYE